MVLDGEEWLTSAEAATQSGRTPRHITRLCEQGKLVCRKEGKAYLIDPVSLEQFISEASSKEAPTEDTMPSKGHSSQLETTPSPLPKPDGQPEKDIQTSSTDMNRTSDIGTDIDQDFADMSDVRNTRADVRRTKGINRKAISIMSEPEPSQPDFDIEELELLQTLVALKRTLNQKVTREKKYAARIEKLLDHLEAQITAERSKNKKFRAGFKKLFLESQNSAASINASLWRRLFG